MMKTITGMLTMALFFCLPTMILADDTGDAKWFDTENCAICKHMAGHAELMEKTTCETHMIDNGMLMVSCIPSEQRATMDAVNKKMEATIAQLMAGKQLPLCGFCTGYGALMAAGGKGQEIKTSFGSISLMTSDDPEVVKKIQSFAKRTDEEYKKMQKQLKHAADK